jgi:hypothetical protein
MRRLPAGLLAAALLAACATPAEPPAAWKACSPIELEQAVARLKTAWRQCFEGQSSHRLVPPGNAMSAGNAAGGGLVAERRDGDVTTLSLRLQSRDFTGLRTTQQELLAADFQMTPDCRTEVTARGSNAFWQQYAMRAAEWLKEAPAAAGPPPCGS